MGFKVPTNPSYSMMYVGNIQTLYQDDISDKADFICNCNGGASCKQDSTQKTALHLLFPIARCFSLSPPVPHWLNTLGSQSSQRFTKHTNTGQT